jgi:hypothetical protein
MPPGVGRPLVPMVGLVASAWLLCPDPMIRTGAPKSYTTRRKNET